MKLLAKQPWERFSFAANVRKRLHRLWNPAQAQIEWGRFLWRRGEGLADSSEALDGLSSTPLLETEAYALQEADTEERNTLVELPLTPTPLPPGPGETLALLSDPGPDSMEGIPLFPPSSPLRSQRLLSLQIPTFAGREEERDLLWDEVKRVCHGAQRLVILEGEAGIGKSRMAQWLLEQTHEKGMMLGLQARFGRHANPSSGILSAIERHYSLNTAPKQVVYRTLEGRWGEAQKLVEGLTELLRPSPFEEISQRPSIKRLGLERQDSRHQLVLEAFTRVARRRPVLLWLDDLQYADEEEFALLSLLLEKGPPLLALLTLRRPDEGHPPRLQAQIDELLHRFSGRKLQLHHLPADATYQLLDELCPLSQEVRQALAAHSQGNPLFLLQMLFAWLQRQQLRWDDENQRYTASGELLQSALESRGELWEQRIAGLPEPVLRAALAATTLGHTFSHELLKSLLVALALPPSLVLTLLEEQLLLARDKQLSWNHGLLEEFLQHKLQQHHGCRHIHLTAARVLDEHPLSYTRSFVRLSIAALLRAGEVEVACERLFGFLENAWKTRRNAPQIRADLALMSAITPGPIPARLEAERWRWQAEAALLSSWHDEAHHAASEALKLYEILEDRRGRAEIQRILGAIATGRSQYQSALLCLERALDEFQSLQMPESIALIYLLVAQTYQYMSRLHESAAYAKKAYYLAEEHNLNTVLIQSCLLQATTHHDLGEYIEARLWANVSLEACRLGGEDYGAGQAYILLAHLDLAEQAYEDALDNCERALSCFAMVDDWWWQTTTHLVLGWLACWQGDRARALELAASTREEFRAHKMEHEVAQAWLLTAAVHLSHGETPEARYALEQARRMQRPEPMFLQPLTLLEAWLAQLQQRPEQAHAALHQCLEIWRNLGVTTWGMARLVEMIQAFPWPPELRDGLMLWSEQLRKGS